MKNICILLNGGISLDARVIKVVRSLSKQYQVDLYYAIPREDDSGIFNKNVSLKPLKSPYSSLKKKVFTNIFFYKVYNYFADEVIASNKQYDYIWANDLPTLLPAFMIKQAMKTETKLVYDSHEIYTATIKQLFSFNTNFFKGILFNVLARLMKYLGLRKEKQLIKEVDVFISVGDAVADYFHEVLKYPRPTVIKNCPLLLKSTSGFDLFRSEFSISSTDIIFLYQGNIQSGRGMKDTITAFLKLENRIKLVVLGDGILKKELKEIVQNSEIKNKIFFKDAVPNSELYRYTCSADYGVNYIDFYSTNTRLACPNKLFEYIQSELPLLMSNNIENKALNDKYNIGICGELGVDNIIKSVGELIKLNKEELIENLKIAKEKLNWEEQEKVIFDTLN